MLFLGSAGGSSAGGCCGGAGVDAADGAGAGAATGAGVVVIAIGAGPINPTRESSLAPIDSGSLLRR